MKSVENNNICVHDFAFMLMCKILTRQDFRTFYLMKDKNMPFSRNLFNKAMFFVLISNQIILVDGV